MKKILFTSLGFLLMNIAFSQVLWDDFDSTRNVTYPFTNGLFNQSYNNILADTVNPSSTSASYSRSSQLYDVIVIEPMEIVADVSSYVDSTKKMSLKVYAFSAGDTIQITLENNNTALPGNYPTGRHSEYIGISTVANQWEEIDFYFKGRPDPATSDTSVNQMVLLFTPGYNVQNTYLFDDLMGPEFTFNPCDTVANDTAVHNDFECQENVTFNFSNGTHVITENPIMDTVNMSNAVGKFKKYGAGGDGAFGGDLLNPFTTSDFKTGHISLYDPAYPSSFYYGLQSDTTTVFDTFITTTSATNWVEHKLDLSGIDSSLTIDGWVFLIEPGSSTEDSIFYDNFRMSNDPVGPPPAGPCDGVAVDVSIIEDFECQRNSSSWFANGNITIVDNPMSDALNSSEFVGKFTKWVDLDTTDMDTVPTDGAYGEFLDNSFNTGSYKTVHFSLLDMNAPSEMQFIITDENGDGLVSAIFNTSTSGVWEEFKLDVSTLPTFEEMGGYIFVFNPATITADSIFYDNLRLSNDVVESVNDLTVGGIEIYPNPVQNVLTISSAEKVNTISIINNLGVIVKTKQIKSNMSNIDVSDLDNGAYIIIADLQSGESVHRKFVK